MSQSAETKNARAAAVDADGFRLRVTSPCLLRLHLRRRGRRSKQAVVRVVVSLKSVEKADAIFSQERDPRFAEMFAGISACKFPKSADLVRWWGL